MALVGKLDILLIAKTAQMENGLKRGGTLAQRFTRNIGASAKSLIGFGSAAAGVYTVTRALRAAVAASDEFNQSMRFSLSILDKVNAAQESRMRLTAQTASFGSRFKAPEAAKGYFYLESAGFSAEQAQAALPATLEFTQAAGGMFELSAAVDLLTDAQVALGMVSEDTSENLANMIQVSDALVGANTLASATVQQFSEALTNKAAASARMLGKDINETLAVLAAFASQNRKGADGGTALAIVWRDLRTKAIENEQAFREMGVAVYDQNGKMRHTADILEDLENALDGASDKLKTMTIQQLGFTVKSADMTTMLIGMSEQIREWNKRLDEMGGKTKQVSESMQTDWEKLKKSVFDIGGFAVRNTLGAFVEKQAHKINVAAGRISGGMGMVAREFNAGAAERGSGIPLLPDMGIVSGVTNKYNEISDALEDRLAPGLDAVANKAAAAAKEMDSLGENVLEAIRNADLDSIAKALELGGGGLSYRGMNDKLSQMDRRMGLDQFDLLRDEVAQMRGEGLDPGGSRSLLGVIDRLEQRQDKLDIGKEIDQMLEGFQRASEQRLQEQDQFAQQFETPGERFDRLTEDLETRLLDGTDPETIRRALVKGIEMRDGGRDIRQPAGVAAVTQGTQAAFALEQQRQSKDIDEKQLTAQEEANEILTDMRDGLVDAGFTVAPIGT